MLEVSLIATLLCIAVATAGLARLNFHPSFFFLQIMLFYFLTNAVVIGSGLLSLGAFAIALLLTLSYVAFSLLGSLLVSNLREVSPDVIKRKAKLANSDQFLKLITRVCILISLGGIFYLLHHAGYSPFVSNPLVEFINVARKYALLRYEDSNYREPFLALFSTIFMYLGNILAGVSFCIDSNSRSKFKSVLLPLLPNILFSLVLTSRAGIFIGIMLFLSSYLSMAVYFKIRVNILPIVRKGIFYFCILIVVIWVPRVLRSGDVSNFSIEYFSFATEKVLSLLVLSFSAFSVWFENVFWIGNLERTHGSIIFGGIASWFGVSRSKFDAVSLGDNLPETTIHGLFAAILSDFGLINGIVFISLFGLMSGLGYVLVRKGYLAAFFMLITSYFFTLGMIVNSVIKFNNVNAAIVMASIIMIFLQKEKSDEKV
jgi:oligosaccharide repeat unit polymerase